MALLVDDILLFPFKGILAIFKEIQKYADRELNDKEELQKKLLETQLLFEMGEMSEEEYNERETYILDRLEALEEEPVVLEEEEPVVLEDAAG
ncbi:gas vesicle protein GvpG [bacterium]|nr:gas vesicle protein GvpG [bacterium]